MSIPNQEIENATLSWISTFPDLLTVPKDFDSLSDGVVLTEIMTQLAPTVFSISNINMEAAEDWAFKLNNLTYLFEGLEKFYSTILGKAFEKTYVDVIKVSKNEDKEQLFNLVELVLGAAVQCDNKELYINAILTLDENCQNALMYLIEKILNRCNDDQQQPEPQTSTEAKTEPTTIQAPPELVKSRDSDFINRSSFLIPPKQDGHVKSLLAKIEELENENNQLSQKVNDLAQERDTSTIKMAELLQELNKKNEDVRNLVVSKEGILEKLTVQESHEELHNELKMKEYKILELSNFVDELKQKHQMELSLVQDELEEQKRKVLQLSKMEGTLEFYKQKFEDYSRIALQMSDMEKQSVTHRNKIEELSAYNENLTSKVNVYREKIEHEKTRNISLDVELTRRATEISSLKNEKKRLESLINELESKLQEQSKIIERHEREFENKRLFGGSIGAERYAGKAGGQDFQEIIQTLEKENENLRLRQNEGVQPVLLEDGEAEILKKENEIIKAKCKEIESENENLRKLVATSEDVKYVDRITNDNQVLKQEVEKVKKAADTAKAKAQNEINALKEFHAKLDSNPNEEMQKEIKEQIRQEILEKEKENEELKETNEKLQASISELNKKLQESRDNDKKESEERNKENLNLLKQEINSKAEIINKLNEKMTGLQASVQATQNLEEELDKKDTQIKELVNEIDMIKTVIEEVGEQKEEELRVLSTALQELAIRNVDLERQINSLKSGSSPSGLASKNKAVVNKIGQRI